MKLDMKVNINRVTKWLKVNYLLLIVLVLTVVILTVAVKKEGFEPMTRKVYEMFPNQEQPIMSFTDLFKIKDTQKTPSVVSPGQIGVVNGKLTTDSEM